jgi:dTDP-glucose 4,6-dehydratase
MTRRVLLTGGCGFIGSNFVRYVLATDEDVEITNLDLLTYAGNRASLADLEDHPRYRFVHGDIADAALVESLFAEGVDDVINMAAESHVDRSIDNPGIFIRTNITGTQVLLDAAQRHGVRRFVQVSTDEVYGSLGATGAFTEKSQIQPSSPYSASKAGADHLVEAYHHTFGLPTNITRCSNNYGPYQFPEKLIPLMIAKARANEPLPVYGDGLNVRDWLHVEDHCAAIWLVLTQAVPGAVYNVGGHNEIANLDLVKQLLAILGKPESLIRFVTDRPGHDRRYAIDPTKISGELGWTPQHNPQRGLQMTVDWYLSNESWWGPLLERATLEHR